MKVIVEHFRTLPDANLEAIAARPVWNAESAVQAVTAGLVLDSRRYDIWSCKDCSGRKCDCLFECMTCGARSEGRPNFCGCSS